MSMDHMLVNSLDANIAILIRTLPNLSIVVENLLMKLFSTL